MDISLIESFISTFYGYGNPRGKYWLIGMEEGGGNSREEVFRRFEIWQELGEGETCDLVEYHELLGMSYYFQEPVKYQRTWGHLIRLILASQGKPTDTPSVKRYQRDRLGRLGDETCSLELLPLSSPSLGSWHYGEWTGISYLQSRKQYRDICLPKRIRGLQCMIARYHPPMVVFYGTTYRPYYEQVIGSSFHSGQDGLEMSVKNQTRFCLVKHPAAWGDGANAGYFEQVGRIIANNLP